MSTTRAAWAAGLLLATSTPLSGQDRAMEILRHAAARYASVSSLCADFVHHRSVPLLRLDVTGRGRLCLAGSNLFGMRFTDPAGDAVVVDGEYTWTYFRSNGDNQVLRFPAGQGAGGWDFHREFLESPESKYDATYDGVEDVGGHQVHRIGLVPKTPTTYRSAVLWIEEGTYVIRQVQYTEENRSVRTITLSDIRFDETPPAGWFEFTPPPGAEVISVPTS